jgi:hypothetical protein
MTVRDSPSEIDRSSSSRTTSRPKRLETFFSSISAIAMGFGQPNIPRIP